MNKTALKLLVDQQIRARLGPAVTELAWCAKCREGKHRSAFPPSAFTQKPRQGSRWCRACNAEHKRLWRQRTAVPCVACGEPCSRENFNRRCQACWFEYRRGGITLPTTTSILYVDTMSHGIRRGENERCAA